eukprot:tig00021352_g20710.t1
MATGMAGLGDCHFFVMGACTRGAACTFRHSEAAKANPTTCRKWMPGVGGCVDRACTFRHPTRAVAPVLAPVAPPAATPCRYWASPTGCNKGNLCPYSHDARLAPHVQPVQPVMTAPHSNLLIDPSADYEQPGPQSRRVVPAHGDAAGRFARAPPPIQQAGGQQRRAGNLLVAAISQTVKQRDERAPVAARLGTPPGRPERSDLRTTLAMKQQGGAFDEKPLATRPRGGGPMQRERDAIPRPRPYDRPAPIDRPAVQQPRRDFENGPHAMRGGLNGRDVHRDQQRPRIQEAQRPNVGGSAPEGPQELGKVKTFDEIMAEKRKEKELKTAQAAADASGSGSEGTAPASAAKKRPSVESPASGGANKRVAVTGKPVASSGSSGPSSGAKTAAPAAPVAAGKVAAAAAAGKKAFGVKSFDELMAEKKKGSSSADGAAATPAASAPSAAVPQTSAVGMPRKNMTPAARAAAAKAAAAAESTAPAAVPLSAESVVAEEVVESDVLEEGVEGEEDFSKMEEYMLSMQ